jgi:biotin transport system substrate-specific component
METQARRATLVDVLPLEGAAALLRDIVLIVAFGSLMGLLARISIPLPFTPVPITGQTFGVLLTGAVLGSRRGALAMLVYLAEGLVGLPVFAFGLSGWVIISGPTGGYLLSYPLAAFAVGFLAERGWDRTFLTAAAAMVVGEIIIYVIAIPWLAHNMVGNYAGWPCTGWRNSIGCGLVPFVPGDIAKLLLAAAMLPSAWALVNRSSAADSMGTGLPR